MTQGQEEFEKFVRRTNGTWADKCLTRGPDCRYNVLQTWNDWIAWQACWSVCEALRQPVETVGDEDDGEPIHQVGWLNPKDPTRIQVTTHYMIRELGNPENWLPLYAQNKAEALRTQLQAQENAK